MPATAYHGTPITPFAVLEALGRRNLCVSFYRPDQDAWADEHSETWFGDCGTFSFWQQSLKDAKKRAEAAGRVWNGELSGDYVSPFTPEYLTAYYAWCRRWCLNGSGRCKWVVIPDPIGTGTQELDALINEWPADLKAFGVPVYHLDEPIERALMLLRRFGRLCVGATGEYRVILSEPFCDRMDELFNAILAQFGFIPPVHFFRGLQLLHPRWRWPIISADSTDIGRNHNRLKKHGDNYIPKVIKAVNRWDAMAAARTQLWAPRAPRPKQLALPWAA